VSSRLWAFEHLEDNVGKSRRDIGFPEPQTTGTGVAPSAFAGAARQRRDDAARRAAPADPAAVEATVLAAVNEGVIVIDRAGKLAGANSAASRILGIDLLGEADDADWWGPLRARHAVGGAPLDLGRQVMARGLEMRDVEVAFERGGLEARLSVNYLPLRQPTGDVAGLVVAFTDVSEREREHRKLTETEDRLREAHDVARLASWEWNPATGDVIVFQALEESGLEPGTTVTLAQWLAMIPAEQHGEVDADFEAFLSGQRDASSRRFRHVLPTGAVWLELRSRAVRDAAGGLICVRGTAQDVTEQELAQQDLYATRDFLQATLDSLSTHVAVLDAHGEIVLTNRAWTDFALENGGRADCGGVGANYLTACEGDRTDPAAMQTADGLRAIIAGERSDYSIEQSCHGPELHRWFQMHATVYDGAGPTRVVVTHENISERKAEERLVAIDLDKLAWVARIEEALSNELFVLHAQPILELASGQIVQRELLIRMRHPDGSQEPGLVPPGYFLPVAEEFGLIMEIDRWVIDRSAELAATGLPVELNVSGRSISDPRLVDYIKGALERTGADPQMLVFEITETTLIEDDRSARAFVARLHALGCKVALDDFGTGYGGFTYLKQLPIDYLKIDVEFVSDLLYNPASRTVVQAIVKLAQGFGLKTVAEGVESGDTMDALRELDVDYVQGYHIGRPAALPTTAYRRAEPR
jgi:EAL domain-containing protein (putative c-di-GMP-specific phosphodiesterase class I)/PAS domain-containing protein